MILSVIIRTLRRTSKKGVPFFSLAPSTREPGIEAGPRFTHDELQEYYDYFKAGSQKYGWFSGYGRV